MPIKRISKKFAYVSAKYDFSHPTENQTICKMTKSLGNNTFQVQSQNDEIFIASLIKMFRGNVMLIPDSSYVITEPIPDGKKVKAEIVRILLTDQIKKLNRDGYWPSIFSDCRDLNNGYRNEVQEANAADTITARKPLCSASHHLGGTTSVTVADQPNQLSDDEDEMPYIPPNPNIKGISKMVSLNNDSASEDEEFVPTVIRRRKGGRRGRRY